MTNLDETSNPKRRAEIDIVGWLFLAFAAVITATAADDCLLGKRRDGCTPCDLAAR